MTVKELFLNAVITCQIGTKKNGEIIIKTSEFKNYFKTTILNDYVGTFLPAATIEKGRLAATHSRYLFRVKRGVYRVHFDAIKEQIKKNIDREKKEADSYGIRNIRNNVISVFQ